MDEITVFYHMGGVIMEDEKKRRQWKYDPPGWYFWGGVLNGDRQLHGPFESRDLAQYQLHCSV